MPYSTLASSPSLITLPAFLIENRYPSYKEKISSGGTLESEQAITKTLGCCPLNSSFKLSLILCLFWLNQESIDCL